VVCQRALLKLRIFFAILAIFTGRMWRPRAEASAPRREFE